MRPLSTCSSCFVRARGLLCAMLPRLRRVLDFGLDAMAVSVKCSRRVVGMHSGKREKGSMQRPLFSDRPMQLETARLKNRGFIEFPQKQKRRNTSSPQHVSATSTGIQNCFRWKRGSLSSLLLYLMMMVMIPDLMGPIFEEEGDSDRERL